MIYDRLRKWNRDRVAKRRRSAKELEDSKLNLAVMGIVKNEELNIEEWIDHYLWQGADGIFIIDNGSTDRTFEKASKYSQSHNVEVVSLPAPHMQVAHYRTAFKNFDIENRFKWLLVADSDEFWFCKNGELISRALNNYDRFKLIYVNWTFFGDCGFVEHPKSLRKDLKMRRPFLGAHEHKKWICRTNALDGGKNIDIHVVSNVSSRATISDNMRFQLNHYLLQSRHYFFEVKAKRGDAVLAIEDTKRDEAYFQALSTKCTQEESLLADYVSGKSSPSLSSDGLAEVIPLE